MKFDKRGMILGHLVFFAAMVLATGSLHAGHNPSASPQKNDTRKGTTQKSTTQKGLTQKGNTQKGTTQKGTTQGRNQNRTNSNKTGSTANRPRPGAKNPGTVRRPGPGSRRYSRNQRRTPLRPGYDGPVIYEEVPPVYYDDEHHYDEHDYDVHD